MKRFILALAVGLCTLGFTSIASAHPPRYERVYHHPVYAPVITYPAPACAPVVVPACETVRPVYHYHHDYRDHRRR